MDGCSRKGYKGTVGTEVLDRKTWRGLLLKAKTQQGVVAP